MNISIFSLSLLLWASTATATGRYCSWPSVYTIATQTPTWTNPELVAGVFVGPSNTTGTISAGYTFTKSWTITGAITGTYALPGIGSVGVTSSYGVTTAEGTSLTVGITCPANIECGLTASTYVLRVTGTQTMYLCGSGDKYDTTYPCTDSAPSHCPASAWNTTFGTSHQFVADYPLAASSSNVNKLLAVDYNACAVGKATSGIPECPSP